MVKSALWTRRIDAPGSIFDFARRAGSGRRIGHRRRSAEPTFPLRYDVRIEVPSTLRVDTNLLRLVASADLTLQGTYDRPVIAGHADIERGEVNFEGRRYRITRGAIDFNNPTRTEPFFDIEAETNVRVPGPPVQTYHINIGFAGTTERLQPTVSSDPALPTADVLALLFSDVRRNNQQDVELRALQNPNQAETDILAARATQALTAPISAEVGKVVEQAFGVDTFQLTPSFVDPVRPADFGSQPDGAADDRQARVGSRLPDLLAQPRHVDQRSDRAARIRGERSALLDPLAQRGSADLRARIPRQALVLRRLSSMQKCTECTNARRMRRSRRSRVRIRAFVHSCICSRRPSRRSGGSVRRRLSRQALTAVRLVLDGRDTTEAALVQVVETQAGRPLSMIEVRESVAHLFSLGRFDDVRVDASAGRRRGRAPLRADADPPGLERRIHRQPLGARHRRRPVAARRPRSVRDVAAARPGRPSSPLAIGETLRQRGYQQRGDHAPGRPGSRLGSGRRWSSTSIPASRTTIGTVAIVGDPMMPSAAVSRSARTARPARRSSPRR